MRHIPAALAAHLDGEATTTCHCWRVTRRDGTVLGFTEHDCDLFFDGTPFLAASGFQASETEAATGLAVTASDVTGGFSSAAISEEDLAAGRYDGARVEVFLVNWRAPAQHMRLRVQEIGEVSRDSSHFRAELRSIAHRLGQPQGRTYNRRCDAAFGDGRCGVDAAAYRATGTVVVVPDSGRIRLSGLEAFAEGFFNLGVLSLIDGANAGMRADIDSHTIVGESAELSFWLPLPGLPRPGDSVSVTAGCDKAFSTCRERFANHLNFRGFPHVPGSDFAYSYADGVSVHDGKPVFE